LITAKINRNHALILLDSGASVSCLSLEFAIKIKAKIQPEDESEQLTSADGRKLQVCGWTEVTVGLNGLLVPHKFFVIEGLRNKVICGLDFLTQTNCKLDLQASAASFFDGLIVLPLQQRAKHSAVLYSLTRCVLPPRCEVILPVRLPQHFAAAVSNGKHTVTAMVEPLAAKRQPVNFLVAKSVVNCKSQDRQACCRVLNFTDHDFVIRKGTPVAVISHAEVLPENKFQDLNVSSVEVNKPQDKELTLEEKVQFLKNMGINLEKDEINAGVYNKFCELLYEYKDIFALSLKDLTGSNLPKCPILTYPDAKPVRVRPYRLNDAMRAEVDRQLDELLEAGIIQESQGSQFASPIVMVKKSTGEYRFCVDLRKINQSCLPLYHPLPSVSDVTDVLARNQAKILTVLDMRSAYFQLGITPETAEKTTFTTPHRGEFFYNRLPMGLSQSGYHMTQALKLLFRHQMGTFLIIYLDDVLICSNSPERHLEHLRIVFQKLREANLKLHPKKCKFLLRELAYLGHIFSAEGVRADPKKTAIVQNFPRPKTVRDVRKFLGLTNYFRSKILHYADKSFGLTKLLRKDVPFKWDEEQEESFQTLKAALVNPPVMALPDTSKEFILQTDASDKSISYNLSQKIDGVERFIEFGGRGLRPAEKNYSTSQKEMLAIIAGIQHFHEYLAPAEFLIRCDNIALTFLNSTKHVTGRLGRWNLLLNSYKYRIEHTKGKNNVVADTLSRLSLPAAEDDDPELKFDELLMNVNSIRQNTLWQIDFVAADYNNTQTGEKLHSQTHSRATENTGRMVGSVEQISAEAVAVTPEIVGENNTADANDAPEHGDDNGDDKGEAIHVGDLDLSQSYDVGVLQSQCPDFSALIEYIQNGVLPQHNDALSRKIIFQSERYVWMDGALWHLALPRNKRQHQVDTMCRQLAVPRSLRPLVLTSYHENMCHIGPEKMYLTLRNKYVWPSLYVDVHQWTKSCLQCQQGKSLNKIRAPLRSLPVEATIFEKWHIDHLTLPMADGYSHVLVCIDSFSLFSILLPAKTTTAEETAQLLYDNLFTVYTCKSLLSDRGSAFRSKLMKELCRLLSINQIFTSAQHPQTNSRCESYNKNILNSLRTHCSGHRNWPKLLSTISHSFRTSVVKNFGFSPYKIVFGIEPSLAVDNLLQPGNKNVPQSVQSYVRDMETQFKILREAVRENQVQANIRTTEQYNKKATTKEVDFPVGSRVWMFNPTTPREKYAHKVVPKWTGPYLVIGAKSDFHVYKLQHCETLKVCPSWIHANRLQLYNDERDKFYTTSTRVVTKETGDVANHQSPVVEGSSSEGKVLLGADDRPATTTANKVTTNHNSAAQSADQPSKPEEEESEWYEIVKVLNHCKKGKITYYRVQWLDGSRSWLNQSDVTQAAIDAYWVDRREKQLKRRQKRKKRRV